MADTSQDSLSSFVSSLTGGDGLRVEERLGSGFVRLRVSEAERRQAKHDIRCVEDAVIELLRNARDAGATRIFLASSREGNVRSLIVIDDGSGIPAEMQERVFDARVTSKLDTMCMDRWGVHGRGMALYSIRENALEAKVCDSHVGKGCALKVDFDASRITERADQSSWPSVSEAEGGYSCKGPRNIIRAAVEFGLETLQTCNVYVGSPSEIVATMRARVRPQTLPGTEPLLVERAALAQNAHELAEVAAGLGLDMSERTAHRIVRGEIEPLRNVRLAVLGPTAARVSKDDFVTRRLALSAEDRQELADEFQEVFSRILERYYLRPSEAPRIRIVDNKMTVTLSYEEDE
ncbi:MAG: ATP-binding protein [Coriobacteriales bacterium]|nr:ATP-binding protein [Coriobacteriales bacterium]